MTACSDPLKTAVNANWPPVDVQQQRQTAINATAGALSHLVTPNLAIAIDLSDAEAALQTSELRSKGVSSVSLTGDEQLLVLDMIFDKTFEESEGGDDQNI